MDERLSALGSLAPTPTSASCGLSPLANPESAPGHQGPVTRSQSTNN